MGHRHVLVLIFFAFQWLVVAAEAADAVKPQNFPKQQVFVQELPTPFAGSVLYAPVAADQAPRLDQTVSQSPTLPGVVLLHGSEGGSVFFYRLQAQVLAMSGYNVLALCWFDCARDPLVAPAQPLERVKIELIAKAATWLKKSSYVRGQKVGLYGFSRGAELAALAAAKIPGVADVLLLHAATDVVVRGFSWSARDPRCWVCDDLSLNCFRQSKNPERWDWAHTKWNPSCGDLPKNPEKESIAAWQFNGLDLNGGERIALEKFPGPILLTHGEKDELREVERSLKIKDQLQKQGRNVDLHTFKNEKHSFSPDGELKRRRLVLDFLSRHL